MTTTETRFHQDHAAMNAELNRLGAVVTYDDGWQGIDSTKAPASLLSTYSNLISVGYAKGWL